MKEKISKEDFEEWQTYEVTKAFYEAIKAEQELAKQFLVQSVDMDSLTMAKFVGIMSGLQKVLDIEYDND